MEQVVPEHKGRRSAIQKRLTNQERLRQTFGARLHRVADLHAPGRTVPEQPLKRGLIVGGGDHQNLTNPRQHQRAEGVIDHRLVVDGQQLFAHRLGDRMQPRSRTAGENDALALLSQGCPPAGRMLAWKGPG